MSIVDWKASILYVSRKRCWLRRVGTIIWNKSEQCRGVWILEVSMKFCGSFQKYFAHKVTNSIFPKLWHLSTKLINLRILRKLPQKVDTSILVLCGDRGSNQSCAGQEVLRSPEPRHNPDHSHAGIYGGTHLMGTHTEINGEPPKEVFVLHEIHLLFIH